MPPPITALIRSRRALIGGGVAVAAVAVGALIAIAMAGPASPAVAVATPTPSPSLTTNPSPAARPRREATPSPVTTPGPTPIAARCPLDGMPLADDAHIIGPALAVQIENHPDARPARNLSNADMIVEATVEGDVTRFTAIFLCNETVGMTGPVRSARYYNIDLWQDLRVLTVGFGRSNGAHERFVRAGMPYPNGMEGWPWYRRYGSHAAPHNLYVDLEDMRAALTTNDALAALAERVDELRPPFSFGDQPALPESGRAVEEITIRTNSYWRIGWTWNADDEVWLRSDAGQPIHDEATDERVAAATLIVQRVTQETVYGDPDPAGNPRRLQHLVGSGEGTIYTAGHAYAIRWDRPTAADRTTWTFADTGEPVELSPGQIWWHILPLESRLTEE